MVYWKHTRRKACYVSTEREGGQLKDPTQLTDEEIVEVIKEELKKSKSRNPILDANETVNEHFEILYGRYQVPIHNYIGKLIFDKEIVDDIFHEVIIKVYTNLSRFTPKTSLKAWIYRIATNVSINYIKRHRYQEKLLLNTRPKREGENREMIDMIKGKEHDIEEKLALDEIMEVVNLVVSNLPKELREVFVLKKYENLTYDEIAEIVGCSSRHVKTRMAKALHIIADDLKKRNITKDILDL